MAARATAPGFSEFSESASDNYSKQRIACDAPGLENRIGILFFGPWVGIGARGGTVVDFRLTRRPPNVERNAANRLGNQGMGKRRQNGPVFNPIATLRMSEYD